MQHDTDTAYMHISDSGLRGPRPVRVSGGRRKPTPATAIVEHSRRMVAEIHEYRTLRAAAQPGGSAESFDLGRLCALEGRLFAGREAVCFPCNLVTWVRVDGGTRCPRIGVVRCLSATRVTLTAHPGLRPGDRVRLTFRMGTSGREPRVTLSARVVRVEDDRVELELDDDRPSEPFARAA